MIESLPAQNHCQAVPTPGSTFEGVSVPLQAEARPHKLSRQMLMIRPRGIGVLAARALLGLTKGLQRSRKADMGELNVCIIAYGSIKPDCCRTMVWEKHWMYVLRCDLLSRFSGPAIRAYGGAMAARRTSKERSERRRPTPPTFPLAPLVLFARQTVHSPME